MLMKIKIAIISFLYLASIPLLGMSKPLEKTIETLKNMATRYVVRADKLKEYQQDPDQKKYSNYNDLVELLRAGSDQPEVKDYLARRLYIMGMISKRITECFQDKITQLKAGKSLNDIEDKYQRNVDALSFTVDLKSQPIVSLIEGFLPCALITGPNYFDLVQKRASLTGADFYIKSDDLKKFNAYANWVEKLLLACMEKKEMRAISIQTQLKAFGDLDMNKLLTVISPAVADLSKYYFDDAISDKLTDLKEKTDKCILEKDKSDCMRLFEQTISLGSDALNSSIASRIKISEKLKKQFADLKHSVSQNLIKTFGKTASELISLEESITKGFGANYSRLVTEYNQLRDNKQRTQKDIENLTNSIKGYIELASMERAESDLIKALLSDVQKLKPTQRPVVEQPAVQIPLDTLQQLLLSLQRELHTMTLIKA